jgi:hypothetical protein
LGAADVAQAGSRDHLTGTGLLNLRIMRPSWSRIFMMPISGIEVQKRNVEIEHELPRVHGGIEKTSGTPCVIFSPIGVNCERIISPAHR